MEKLFSYGTLQLEKVQLDTFGRKLVGKKDTLIGYRLEQIEISDPAVLASSSENFHPILRPSKNKADRIQGVIFEITKEELLKADTYEEENYRRVAQVFESGTSAWVYVGK